MEQLEESYEPSLKSELNKNMLQSEKKQSKVINSSASTYEEQNMPMIV